MKLRQKIIGIIAGAIVILFLVTCYLLMFKPWLFMDYEPDQEYIQSEKEIIYVNGQEWYMDEFNSLEDSSLDLMIEKI